MRIPREVLLVGLPSCIMNIMGVLSNIVLNKLMASYCNEAVAGIGIAKKVDMMSFAIATGMSQGVLPLIGYNYSAKNYRRMMSAVKDDVFVQSDRSSWRVPYSCSACAQPIVRAFIDDPLTVEYGQRFPADHLHHRPVHIRDNDHHHAVPVDRYKSAAFDSVSAA
jgi:Na+-driven multidrug efflux pump